MYTCIYIENMITMLYCTVGLIKHSLVMVSFAVYDKEAEKECGVGLPGLSLLRALAWEQVFSMGKTGHLPMRSGNEQN